MRSTYVVASSRNGVYSTHGLCDDMRHDVTNGVTAGLADGASATWGIQNSWVGEQCLDDNWCPI